MATINSKKLLPPSKVFSSRLKNKKILIPVSNIRVKKNAKTSSEDLKGGSSSGISSDSLLGIKNVISKIQDVLLKSSIFKKKEQDNKRKGQEKEARKKRESKLEKKPTNKNVESGIASLPNLSFIDRIKKFLFWTILGRFFSDLFPKLIEFSKIILPAVNFIANFAGNILKGVVDFIDWGYIAYDKVRDLTKQIGGESAQKVFDDFSKHFNTFLNLALIAAMAGSGIGGGDSGKKLGKPGKPGQYGGSGGGKPTAADRTRNARIRNIQKEYGPNARKIYENALNNGKTPQQAEAAVKRGFKKGVSIRPGADSLAAKTAKSGSIFNRGLGKLPSRLATKTFGKVGVKIAGKTLGRIPIIGGLVNFLFALWSGEKPGRAAAKAVGATIGSALGTFIPIPIAGTILGGILGDIVGGALYDTLVAGNNKKTQTKAKGGNIGKVKVKPGGNKKRTISIAPKKPKKIEPQKTSIGKDIGGKRKIEEIYGKVELGKKSPLRALIKTSNDLKQMKSLNGFPAAMFSAGVDMTLGQKPSKDLPNQIGNTFGSIVESSINAELSSLFGQISKTLTLAEGGSITAPRKLNEGGVNNIGKKIGSKIASTLSIAINSSATKIFNNLNQEFNLRQNGDGGSGPDSPPIEPGNIKVSSDSPDFWLLTTAALFENGKPKDGYQGAADVAQAIYNRVSLPGWPKSIRGVILSPGQFQPVRTYGGTAEWSKINSRESAIAFAKKYKGYSGNIVDQIAASLLDSSKQQNARTFVGPRDNFRSDSYEKSNDHLDDSTEKSRYGHTFGFEPRGANIGKFKKGEITAAEVNKSVVKGSVEDLLTRDGKPTTGSLSVVLPYGRPTFTSGFRTNDRPGHNGIDIGVDANSPVIAIQDGKVIDIYKSFGNWGNAVVVKHSDGSQYIYGHINESVSTGAPIKKGQVIGKVKYWPKGAAGAKYDNNTHLHLERKDPNGRWINPSPSLISAYNTTQASKTTSNPPTQSKNFGVKYQGGQFQKLGPFGINQNVKVTDKDNTYLREISSFGLGKGKKEGEVKTAADGKKYQWFGNKWVEYNSSLSSLNASLPVSNLSQSVAQIGDYAPGDILMQREIIIIDRSIA